MSLYFFLYSSGLSTRSAYRSSAMYSCSETVVTEASMVGAWFSDGGSSLADLCFFLLL